MYLYVLCDLKLWPNGAICSQRSLATLVQVMACGAVRPVSINPWWRHQMETFPRHWPFVPSSLTVMRSAKQSNQAWNSLDHQHHPTPPPRKTQKYTYCAMCHVRSILNTLWKCVLMGYADTTTHIPPQPPHNLHNPPTTPTTPHKHTNTHHHHHHRYHHEFHWQKYPHGILWNILIYWLFRI